MRDYQAILGTIVLTTLAAFAVFILIMTAAVIIRAYLRSR